MPGSEKNWKTLSPSLFPWEQEALDFVFERFPPGDAYRAWSNFEFIADDGSINEIDLLVACPQGIFVVEIKSNPGNLSGDTMNWTWEHEGRKKTVENPRILANRKCKRLKSLLIRQSAFRKLAAPYFEPLIFVSHSDVKCRLSGTAAHNVALRDVAGKDGAPERPGIMAALRRRECAGLKAFSSPPVNRPVIRAVALAMDQAGIRPAQGSRRVGDFILEKLVYDSPTGAYQDWTARHASIESTTRYARIYMVARQVTAEEREVITKAAHREFLLLERLDHPGILKADPPTSSEHGPVLFFRRSPEAIPLDQFLRNEGPALTVNDRLAILRQIIEIVQYAHGQKVIHRSLSPQSVLLRRDADGKPVVQICNWQTGARLGGSLGSGSLQRSSTLHVGQLIEDASMVYLAPEAISGGADGDGEMDVFSLGALAYLLFTEKPPAESVVQLQQKLRSSLSNGLDVRADMDGAAESLVEMVKGSANAIASDRDSVEDCLTALDLIEDELTRPDEEEKTRPLDATIGDRLPGGLVIEKRLGSGAVSVVFLVRAHDGQWVLKLAREAKYNERIEREFAVLEKLRDLRFREIVKPHKLHRFGDLAGFTMESAGEETLARRIKREGPLDLTWLKRFGDDLLRTVRDLDEHGITHRDIKPDNIGLRVPGKKEYQLCIFDFSLANTSPDDIRVGTLAYLDPFISERKVKRWDVSSELFSAAMTLHEMATGVLPQWGDGRSDPASLPHEVTIRGELFDPDLRERFVAFFQRSLQRDYRKRFDNPAAMLEAWDQIFTAVDKPKTEHDDPSVFEIPENVTAGTQLVLFGLSTRLLNTLDRLNLVTVADLVRVNIRRIYRLPGVGNKTRRELGKLVADLRDRLPEIEIDTARAIDGSDEEAAETTPDAEAASVDLMARQVSILGRGTDRVAEQEVLQRFLGWAPAAGHTPCTWISQSDLAPALGLSRQRIGQVLTKARARWTRFPAITALRDSLHALLGSLGGVALHGELIEAVLAARGSSLEEPRRTQMASIAVRAAMETERHAAKPRFLEYRSDGKIFIARIPELKTFAQALGDAADRLAAQDPLPSPPSVLATLKAVRIPALPEDVAAPSDNRLCQLAAAASRGAALSSRREIYPVGLEPRRSLTLAQNAFFGGSLTVKEIRSRIAARYPQAAPLPDRPALDRLITSLGLELKWNPAAAKGAGAYEVPSAGGGSLDTSESFTSRYRTRLTASRPPEVSPQLAEALTLENKLTHAAKHGAFLALSVTPGRVEQARADLCRRFPVEECDLDALFLTEMKRQAALGGADWAVVQEADAAPPDSLPWKNLNLLVERALPAVRGALRSPDKTRLLVNPGLLARYDRLHVLAELAGEVGRSNGVHGIWVLLPASDQNPLPTLNRKAIPMITGNAAQHVRLTEAWLANKHRA